MRVGYVGLSTSHHDSSLALVDAQGRLVFAEATERALQSKRAIGCPPDGLLSTAKLIRKHLGDCDELVVCRTWDDAWLAAVSEWSANSLSELLARRPAPGEMSASRFATWPFPDLQSVFSMLRASAATAGSQLCADPSITAKLRTVAFNHHDCHAFYACMISPFQSAACAVLDGGAEAGSLAFYSFENGLLRRHTPSYNSPDHHPRASLGMYYAALCALCGFDPLVGEEWKVMGLAPYGTFDREIESMLAPMIFFRDGRLDSDISPAGLQRVIDVVAAKLATGDDPAFRANLAATGQAIFERTLFDAARYVGDVVGSRDLVLAGGCALNSSANGKILANTNFARLSVPSAPADDGNSIGAAMLGFATENGVAGLDRDAARTPFLGSSLDQGTKTRAVAELRRLGLEVATGADVNPRAAQLLAAGKIVGVCRGRAEFGPRALGNRSLLADPRRAEMKDHMNRLIKGREYFRPFAPAVLTEHAADYFVDHAHAPYMERTLKFREAKRQDVPAVVHADGTGRLQTVDRDEAPEFHDLLTHFFRITSVPVLLNTSFNVMGKPISHSVEDAVALFLTTPLDALVLDDTLIVKNS